MNLVEDSGIVRALVSAFLIALLIGWTLVRLKPWIGKVARERDDHLAVQASHAGDTIRLGGLAVLAGMLGGAALLSGRSSGGYTLLFLATLVPVFSAGLFEDLGYMVSARKRFLAALVSALVAVSLLGLWVQRGDLVGLDQLMGFAPAGIVVTVLLAAIFCHAVNLIDGMNGLAATVTVVAGLGLGDIAAQAGTLQIAVLAHLLAAAAAGFFLVNWPGGRLFLGDAGAYSIGHVLVWLGISLIALRPEVSVPSVILVLFYPFADTLHTVLRRWFAGKQITAPDRMHLHQKVRRFLELVWIGRGRRHVSNPLTTVAMLPVLVAPVAAGVWSWNRPPWQGWLALAASAAAFTALHPLVVALARRLRKGSCPEGKRPLSPATR
ncbi:MAG: hypothetical protein D6801_08060 [Alphaproteobacteria bacterium]|nr:MAG: hypothetical protein D6801_08060 [Alphaproteobacteria bacterium]